MESYGCRLRSSCLLSQTQEGLFGTDAESATSTVHGSTYALHCLWPSGSSLDACKLVLYVRYRTGRELAEFQSHRTDVASMARRRLPQGSSICHHHSPSEDKCDKIPGIDQTLA